MESRQDAFWKASIQSRYGNAMAWSVDDWLSILLVAAMRCSTLLDIESQQIDTVFGTKMYWPSVSLCFLSCLLSLDCWNAIVLNRRMISGQDSDDQGDHVFDTS